MPPIKRLDAEPVAGQRQPPRRPVPQGKGEHAFGPFQQRAYSVAGAPLDQQFGIGMAAPANPGGLQLPGQFGGVVQLSIVDEDEAAASRDHRLGARRAEIDDGQAAVAERQPDLAIHPHSLGVGTAVPKPRGHVGDGPGQTPGVATTAVEKAGNAAHGKNHPWWCPPSFREAVGLRSSPNTGPGPGSAPAGRSVRL